MKRLQIYVAEELDEALAHRARRTHSPLGDLLGLLSLVAAIIELSAAYEVPSAWPLRCVVRSRR
jgi:hypothetical protein